VRPEELITRDPSAQEVVDKVERLPSPEPGAVDEVRRELEASADAPSSSGWPAFLEHARAALDVRYPEPATSERPLLGPPLVLAKRSFRAVFQPFINEVLRKQVLFNQAILDAAAQIYEHLQQHVRTQALWRQELDERLTRIEQELKKRG
jgi:hypothetical protein